MEADHWAQLCALSIGCCVVLCRLNVVLCPLDTSVVLCSAASSDRRFDFATLVLVAQELAVTSRSWACWQMQSSSWRVWRAN